MRDQRSEMVALAAPARMSLHVICNQIFIHLDYVVLENVKHHRQYQMKRSLPFLMLKSVARRKQLISSWNMKRIGVNINKLNEIEGNQRNGS